MIGQCFKKRWTFGWNERSIFEHTLDNLKKSKFEIFFVSHGALSYNQKFSRVETFLNQLLNQFFGMCFANYNATIYTIIPSLYKYLETL